MACGSTEVTTEYVPLQYGSWLVWGCDRSWLAGRLRLQPNMSRCNMYHGSSEVTSEYVPLQYVSWINMARHLSEVRTDYGLRGLSEVSTEYVPLQYVSWLVWGYNRICPAAICLMDPMMTPWTLKIHENESRTPYFTPFNHLKLIWKQSARKFFRLFLTNFQPFDPMMTPLDTQNSLKIVQNTLFYPPEPFKIDLEKITSKKISAIFDHF